MTNPTAFPKPAKKKKPTKTASEERHSAAIHEMRCIVTRYGTVIEHHCFTGGGGRQNHFKTIPLAPWMHTKDERQAMSASVLCGADVKHKSKSAISCLLGGTIYPALHENRKLFAGTYGTETELLLKTYEKLNAIGKLEPGARKIWEAMW